MIMDKNRVWGHMELAQLYFPGILSKSASSQFSHWISRDEELLAELRKAGYRKGDGKITPDEWLKECPCFNAEEEYGRM